MEKGVCIEEEETERGFGAVHGREGELAGRVSRCSWGNDTGRTSVCVACIWSCSPNFAMHWRIFLKSAGESGRGSGREGGAYVSGSGLGEWRSWCLGVGREGSKEGEEVKRSEEK